MTYLQHAQNICRDSGPPPAQNNRFAGAFGDSDRDRGGGGGMDDRRGGGGKRASVRAFVYRVLRLWAVCVRVYTRCRVHM